MSGERSDIQAWLEANTTLCALGKVSDAQCAANRSKPTVAQWANRGLGKVASFRPTACEGCDEWRERKMRLKAKKVAPSCETDGDEPEKAIGIQPDAVLIEIPTVAEESHQVECAIAQTEASESGEIPTEGEVLHQEEMEIPCPDLARIAPEPSSETPISPHAESIPEESNCAAPKQAKPKPVIKCRHCGRRKSHKARGLCGMCWNLVREAERRSKMGDCNRCEYWKSMGNPMKGVRIPGGFGKCTRNGGHCSPEKPRLGIGGAATNWQPRQGGAKGGK